MADDDDKISDEEPEYAVNTVNSTRAPVPEASHDEDETIVELGDVLDLAIEKEASDVHLGEDEHISLRIHGKLIIVDGVDKLSRKQAESIIFSTLEPDEKNQLLKVKEIDYSYEHTDGTMFRGNAFYRHGHIAVTLRLIPKIIKSIEDLQLPPFVHRLINAQQGLVLVTGPTGSGKSTSLAAMLEHINLTQIRHIITIEDPIEFIFKSKKSIFSQRELHTDTLSFRRALKSVLREDPDVVVISELRDPETITSAMTIAETGHLVFGTLHTSGAPQTISRIVSAFPPVQQEQIQARLADSLLGVVSQRLVQRIGGGRVGVYETMLNTNAVANLIRTGDTHQIHNAMQTGRSLGMQLMKDSAKNLIMNGIVEQEEIDKMFPDELEQRVEEKEKRRSSF